MLHLSYFRVFIKCGKARQRWGALSGPERGLSGSDLSSGPDSEVSERAVAFATLDLALLAASVLEPAVAGLVRAPSLDVSRSDLGLLLVALGAGVDPQLEGAVRVVDDPGDIPGILPCGSLLDAGELTDRHLSAGNGDLDGLWDREAQ